jgi:hypothetical protein
VCITFLSVQKEKSGYCTVRHFLFFVFAAWEEKISLLKRDSSGETVIEASKIRVFYTAFVSARTKEVLFKGTFCLLG